MNTSDQYALHKLPTVGPLATLFIMYFNAAAAFPLSTPAAHTSA
jgi:hypothetical protein